MTFFRGIVARVRKLFVTHPEVIWSVLIFVLPVFALILLMAILTSYAPSLDHHLGELKKSGWHALEVVWSVVDFKLIMNIVIGSIPALCLLYGLAVQVMGLRGHMSTIELYLARIAIQQVPGATKLEVIAPSQGTRGTILSSEDPSAKVSPEIVLSS